MPEVKAYLYMKIQNLGKFSAWMRTLFGQHGIRLVEASARSTHPQKMREREKRRHKSALVTSDSVGSIDSATTYRFAMFPAVSALSIPAIIATANVLVNQKN